MKEHGTTVLILWKQGTVTFNVLENVWNIRKLPACQLLKFQDIAQSEIRNEWEKTINLKELVAI